MIGTIVKLKLLCSTLLSNTNLPMIIISTKILKYKTIAIFERMMVINCVLRLLIYSTRPYSIMATNNGGKFNDDASDKDMPIDIARNTKNATEYLTSWM